MASILSVSFTYDYEPEHYADIVRNKPINEDLIVSLNVLETRIIAKYKEGTLD